MINENKGFAPLQENVKSVEVKELPLEEFWSGSISVEGLKLMKNLLIYGQVMNIGQTEHKR